MEGGTKKAQTLSPTAQVTATRMLELSFCLGVQVSLWLLYTTISDIYIQVYEMHKIFHFYTYQNRNLIHEMLNLNILNSIGGGGPHLNFYQMHVHYGLICRIKYLVNWQSKRRGSNWAIINKANNIYKKTMFISKL